MPGEDEPLHAFITASTHDSVMKAVRKVCLILFLFLDYELFA
jgi:hypothetical protein